MIAPMPKRTLLLARVERDERIKKLPKWAREEIAGLEKLVKVAMETIALVGSFRRCECGRLATRSATTLDGARAVSRYACDSCEVDDASFLRMNDGWLLLVRREQAAEDMRAEILEHSRQGRRQKCVCGKPRLFHMGENCDEEAIGDDGSCKAFTPAEGSP